MYSIMSFTFHWVQALFGDLGNKLCPEWCQLYLNGAETFTIIVIHLSCPKTFTIMVIHLSCSKTFTIIVIHSSCPRTFTIIVIHL